jgi:hypothetical protein
MYETAHITALFLHIFADFPFSSLNSHFNQRFLKDYRLRPAFPLL